MNEQDYPGGASRPAPESPEKNDKKLFSIVGFALFAAFALNVGLSILLPLLAEKVLPGIMSNPYFYWGMYILVMYVAAFPVGIAILRAVPRKAPDLAVSREKSGLSLAAFLGFLLCAYPMMYAGNYVGSILNSLLYTFTGRSSALDVTELMSEGPLWLSAIMTVVAAPVMEEIFFRGALMGALRGWGDRTAILVSALAFGLFHANLQQFCYAALLGLLLGYVYARTGKLIYTILLHMMINLFSGFLPSWLLTEQIDFGSLNDLLDSAVSGLDESGLASGMAAFVADNLPGLLLYAAYAMVLLALIVSGALLLFSSLRSVRLEKGPRSLERSRVGDTVFLAPGMALFIFASIGFMIWNVLRL